MARHGHHTRSRLSPEEGEDEEAEDPLDAMIRRSGCLGPHRQLQECMAERQDWRHCQPQVRAFGECMTRRQRPGEPPRRAPSSSPAQPAPAGD